MLNFFYSITFDGTTNMASVADPYTYVLCLSDPDPLVV
jgi:hypothetical protein